MRWLLFGQLMANSGHFYPNIRSHCKIWFLILFWVLKISKVASVIRMGYFWKILVYKLSYNSWSNMWHLFRLFWKRALLRSKLLWLLFGFLMASWGSFIPTSGHIGSSSFSDYWDHSIHLSVNINWYKLTAISIAIPE